MSPRYEVRVAGQLDETTAEVFADLDVRSDGATTSMTGELDQAALHELLDRVRELGLELVDVKRAPPMQ